MDINKEVDDVFLESFRKNHHHALICICFRCEKERFNKEMKKNVPEIIKENDQNG